LTDFSVQDQAGAPAEAPFEVGTLAPAFDPLTAPLEQVVVLADVPRPTPAHPLAAAADVLVGLDRPDPLGPVDPLDDAGQPDADQPDASDGPEMLDAPSSETVQPAPTPDVDAIFARLAAEHQNADTLSPWADRLGDKSTRAVVMLVGALGSAVLLFLVLWLLSLVG
jgi:hypothetical protein